MKLISQEMLAAGIARWAQEARDGKWPAPTPDMTVDEIGRQGAQALWPLLDSAQQGERNAQDQR